MIHILIDIGVSDKKYLIKLREELLNNGCFEKYSGDLSVFYINIYVCRDIAVLIGFRDNYYIDIVSTHREIDSLLDILVKVFPRNKINLHYVERFINK